MSRAIRIALIVIGILVVAGWLVFAGTWIGHRTAYGMGWAQPGYRMMDGYNRPDRGNGPGMMGNNYDTTQAPALRSGACGDVDGGGGPGTGMMGNNNGMMGYGTNNPPATPLTVDQAYQAAGTYLTALNNPDLKIAEVMAFDNNAYVRVVEQSTGTGAFELLVDPASLAVTPEHGPNMMWNLKYTGLNHQYMMGGGGGMMGNRNFSSPPADVSATMTVSPEQALQAAQQYLDTAQPGTKTAADADPFYGYYTIDTLRDGKVVGMLSVNGSSGQVFPHTWHGTFLAMQDY
jgi:hypothetical protein